jgi:hypothetical protein
MHEIVTRPKLMDHIPVDLAQYWRDLDRPGR